MNINEALKLLQKDGRAVFNNYRKDNPEWIPDFSGKDLSQCNLVVNGVNLVNLDKAILFDARLPIGDKFSSYGKTVSLDGAKYNMNTSGQTFDRLDDLGAIYITDDKIAKRKESASPQIFISYAWANAEVVSAIDYWLRIKGLDTKIDKRDFFAGSRIQEEILRMMKDSGVVLVFHSFESKDKPWIEFERELVADLQMTAKTEGRVPPRVIYVVIDDTPLPGITEKNKIAIMAKGKRFELVCEEIYHHILQLPRTGEEIDLSQWQDFVF